MIQYLECFYKEQPMGVMSWNPDLVTGWFEFQPAFWQSALSFSPVLFPDHLRGSKAPLLPIGSIGGTTQGLPSFFADALPGKYARNLLQYALLPSGKSIHTLSPLAWCSLLGKRGMGAFRFEPSGYPELDAIAPVDIALLVRHALQLNLNDPYTDSSEASTDNQHGKRLSDNRLRELLRSGMFTTDETPTAWIGVNDFTGEVVSGQATVPTGYDAWTIHLDGVSLSLNKESTASRLQDWHTHHKKALAAGLDVLPCRQMHEGQQTHLLSKRIDRDGKEAVHVQSYKALREENGPEAVDSCEGVFRCLRLLRLPYKEHEEWYKRVVFNGLASNRQERASNVFFEYKNDSVWHLAAFNGFPPARSENLTLAGKTKDWTLDDFRLLGKQQHIRRFESLIQSCQSALTDLT